MLLNELIKDERIKDTSIIFRKSNRAKNIIIKPNPFIKSIELICPKFINQKYAESFLLKNKDWVIDKAIEMSNRISLIEQKEITLMGNKFYLKITKSKINKSSIIDNNITVYAETIERASCRLNILLNKYAHEQFDLIAKEYSELIGTNLNKLYIKDTKSRWGSCSSDKNISLSWRLLFAPSSVSKYVIAHEVAHLKEMNHSKKFWNIVETICPEFKTNRKWLKEKGYLLYQYY